MMINDDDNDDNDDKWWWYNRGSLLDGRPVNVVIDSIAWRKVSDFVTYNSMLFVFHTSTSTIFDVDDVRLKNDTVVISRKMDRLYEVIYNGFGEYVV